MATQRNNSSLSQTLWNNAKVKGIKIIDGSNQLTDQGHGLYVLSDKGDSYCDLRLNCSKPFWGHSHPLSVQNHLGELPDHDAQTIIKKWNYGFLDTNKLQEFDNCLTINFKEINNQSTNNLPEYFKLIVDEQVLFNFETNKKQITEFVEKFQNHSKIWIEEEDLLLANNKQFFSFDFNSKSILHTAKTSLFKNSLIKFSSSQFSQNITIHSSYEAAFLRFYFEILIRDMNGKLSIDEAILNQHKESFDELIGHYIKIQNKNGMKSEDFIKHGLFVNDDNFSEDQIVLSLAPACTKDELLDTVYRIQTLLLES